MSSCSGAETTGAESLEVGELVEGHADTTINMSSFKTTDSTLLNIKTFIDVIPYPQGFQGLQERQKHREMKA
ncbi:hypothetical protein MKX03_030047 [Papaver bracteatum]|nr:hypothetical protein MKX03_030047 [Papaver bracteatum]